MRPYFSVFKDETKLDINYIPPSLPHRESELNLLNQFFRSSIERPGKMSQRVLITGRVGTGKTVLSQRFGIDIVEEARRRRINLKYVHVNCRECRGSLFMILQRIVQKFHPKFPRRGYSAQELLQSLMDVLDHHNAYLILALDELEALIQHEGSDALYNLTRVQEERFTSPRRLSLICILRQPEYLGILDPSTRSTLQHNLIHLREYSKSQLQDILNDRVSLAFRSGTVPTQTISLIAELAESEGGDARYAIELLWRAGKYADSSFSPEVLPEHVRKAATSIHPVIRKDEISSLSLHEKIFLLGIVRFFRQSDAAYMPMGEAEKAYAIVCEEYGEKPRSHTQLWKYAKNLSGIGILKIEPSTKGRRGRTTLISLPRVSASELERELTHILHIRTKRKASYVN